MGISRIITRAYSGLVKLNKTTPKSPRRYYADQYMQSNVDYVVGLSETNDYFTAQYMASNVDYVAGPVAVSSAPFTTENFNAANGSFTSYTATCTTATYSCRTDNTFDWTDNVKKGTYFTVPSLPSSGDTVYVGFIYAGFTTALIVALTNDTGTIKYAIGNAADTLSATTAFVGYNDGDVLCIAVDKDASANGTVYLYHDADFSTPVATRALPNPVGNNPTCFNAYFPSQTGTLSVTIVENPTSEVSDVTRYV